MKRSKKFEAKYADNMFHGDESEVVGALQAQSSSK